MTSLPPASWREQPGLDTLLDALGAGDGTTRFVGGAVRDTLLGLAVKDVDCATRLAPEETMRRVKAAGFKAVPTGLAHGTVTAVLPSGPIEVTTLRRDVATDGRHATIAFTDDWKEDAARRDFTINALFADPASGAIHDYFGGTPDLADGLVRFIGDPLQRIAEDHLRIMRFFRFHARFGRGAPDQAALGACRQRANDLMALSRERIADELLKLLGVTDPGPTVALMRESGIFTPVIPEIDASGVDRLVALVAHEAATGTAPDPLRRLGALLPQDPKVAAGVAQRLKLSKLATRRIEQTATPSDAPGPAIAYRFGADVARDLLLRRMASTAELAPLDGWQRPSLPVGGGTLIARGLSAGPVVAATLQAIERQWIDEGFPPPPRLDAIVDDALAQALRARI
jgi:poly(A) polymerase